MTTQVTEVDHGVPAKRSPGLRSSAVGLCTRVNNFKVRQMINEYLYSASHACSIVAGFHPSYEISAERSKAGLPPNRLNELGSVPNRPIAGEVGQKAASAQDLAILVFKKYNTPHESRPHYFLEQGSMSVRDQGIADILHRWSTFLRAHTSKSRSSPCFSTRRTRAR